LLCLKKIDLAAGQALAHRLTLTGGPSLANVPGVLDLDFPSVFDRIGLEKQQSCKARFGKAGLLGCYAHFHFSRLHRKGKFP
jgi:hypothetical protein